MVSQSCRRKWKKNIARDLLKLIKKRISPTDGFIILQLFRSVRLHCKWFSGEKIERKQKHYKKRKLIRCFNIISIAVSWSEIGCSSGVSVINQSWSTNFTLLLFLRCLCFIHGQLAVSLRRMKRSVICLCQYFCLFDIQGW